jgi:GH15 family glucan-1,4-alpha-glucosidase
LRDATFTLYALLISGFMEEARDWENWLLRSVAGRPEQLQIMFGVGGERMLHEQELPWLPGYEASRPVRIGTAAHSQFQLDVYGEVMDVFHVARRGRLAPNADAWNFQRELLNVLESVWRNPDEGIWEVRGPRRHFTHSKVMAWVAFDRAVRAVEEAGLDGPIDRWRALRDEVHRDVCENGFNVQRNSFVQYYGGNELDASLLMMPLVGFLPATDPRVVATTEAIQAELTRDGFVLRYLTNPAIDGLPAGEAHFLPCTLWLADVLIIQGNREQAKAFFERVLAATNDLGLLSEEYDPVARRQLGNFPQAFSHVALVNTAHNLALERGPAMDRSSG